MLWKALYKSPIIIIINRTDRHNSRFFYNLLTAPRTVSNMYAKVAWAQSCAKHVQHIERLSRATCTSYEGTAQLLNLIEWKSHSC